MKLRILMGALIVAGTASSAVIVGQIDTFSGGVQGWIAPDPDNPNPPVTALGGPGGALDAYLRLTANGGAFAPELAGSRLTVLNQSRWAGNYSAAGVGSLSMDVRNFGPADLYLRLLFESFTQPGPPTALALSRNAVFVPAGSPWTRVVFPIDPGSLLPQIGTVNAALSNTSVLRIFSNPKPVFGGPENGPPMINVVAGIDNITAVAAPEPGSLALLISGLGGLAALRVLRNRKPAA